MKFGIVSDIHAGYDVNTKRGSTAETLLAAALEEMERAGCAFVVDLGDRISERGRPVDLATAERLHAVFARSGLPHHHLCGNHDLYTLSRQDNEALFGPSGSRILEGEGVSLILFDADMDSLEDRMAFRLSAAKLSELRDLLAAASGRSIVLTHVPLLSRSMEGSFYFERAWTGGHCYLNADAIRGVLEQAPLLAACIAGHVHWASHMAVDGIHICTLGSLTETFMSHPDAEATFAVVEVADRLAIDCLGAAPLGYRLPLRRSGQRWMNMHRPGAPRPAELSARYRQAFGAE